MESTGNEVAMYGFNKEKQVFNNLKRIFDTNEDFSDRQTYRTVMTYNTGEETKASEKEKEWRSRKIRQHFDDLISNSTFHGLHFCFDKKHSIRRICWSILILTAFGLLVQKLYESTQHFFSYPFSTTTTIKYKDSMLFPAVSICNLNDFRLSMMKNTTLHKMITQGGDFSKLDGDEYKKTIRRANHKIEDMLYKCKIKNEKCTAKNFTHFYHNQGDKCFTFNSGHKGYRLINVNNTGLKQALELTIHIEHHDYYLDTAESGLHLILHGQDETPVKMQGVMVSPGFKTFVQVKKRKLKNLPAPYKTNCGKLRLKYFPTYSMHLCWLEKLTDHVVGKCGCKDWFMPGKHKVCTLQESMHCMWGHWAAFDNNKMYTCPLPCVIDTYLPTLSFAHYPSNKFADKLANETNITGTTTEKRRYIRDNYLQVVIYYSELSYELMEQLPSYDLMVLLGDIGGQLGLFLGSSVLTYVEFFDCLIMVIYTRFFEIFRTRPQGV